MSKKKFDKSGCLVILGMILTIMGIGNFIPVFLGRVHVENEVIVINFFILIVGIVLIKISGEKVE